MGSKSRRNSNNRKKNKVLTKKETGKKRIKDISLRIFPNFLSSYFGEHLRSNSPDVTKPYYLDFCCSAKYNLRSSGYLRFLHLVQQSSSSGKISQSCLINPVFFNQN